MLVVSSLCQSLYPTLVRRTNDHVITGPSNGTLTSRYNTRQLSILWLVSSLSTLASICFVLGAARSQHSAGNRKAGPGRSGEAPKGRFGGLVRRKTNRFLDTVRVGGSYQKLGGGGEALVRDRPGMGERKGNVSELELNEREENGRDEGKARSLLAGPYRGLRDEDSRYEPMRHHGSVET